MPRGTTPETVHKGQVMPNWARIALRMNSLLFGSLSRNRASSSSTLNATICDFCDFDGFASFRAMTTPMSRNAGLPHRMFRHRRTQGERPAGRDINEQARPEDRPGLHGP